MRFYPPRLILISAIALLSFTAPLLIYFFGGARAIAQTTPDAREAEGDRLLEMAFQQHQASQFREAIQLLQQALAIYQEINDREKEGTTLNRIGTNYLSLGQYSQALDYYHIRKEVGDRSGEGTTLSNIGGIYSSLGQYPKALDYHQQALLIRRDISDRKGEGNSLNNIGFIYNRLGQYPQALDYFQQSLLISREIGNRSGEGTALDNIGTFYDNLGQYPQALDYFQQSLLIRREIGDRESEGGSLNNIGLIYNRLGQYPQALDYYQQSLAISREIGDRSGESNVINSLGTIYSSLGQKEQALDYFQQALVMSQEIGNRSDEGNSLNNIGFIYSSLGQYPQAIDYYQQSLLILRNIGDRPSEGNTLNSIGVAYFQSNQFADAEKNLFAALTVLQSLRDVKLSDADRVSLFETQASSYGFLQRSLIAQNTPEKTLKALEVSEQARARSLIELLSSRLSDSAPTPVSTTSPDLAGIRRIAQQQNATLVQYSVLNTRENPVLYIWVIKPTGEIGFKSVDLRDLDQPLSKLVESSRTAIGVRNRSGDATIAAVPTAEALQQQEAQQKRNLQQLYQLLIQPIAQDLPQNETDRIIFIPQGELFLVPFAALVDTNGKYLIENHTILTSPSIQVLDLTHQMVRQRPERSTNEALVVGNPTMPKFWNSKTGQEQQLSGLPGAATEARAIAAQLQTQPLLAGQATEAVVRQRMANARIIHLATHGLLEYGKPSDSGVLDAPGAIALAPDAQDDGLLTSAEIYNMQLNADLVVLSACDTGRGTLTGDGVIGLSRSLITAGTPSVIVSLWAVPDAPTAELMSEFYRQWQQTPDKAQALRQAMLATMRTPSHSNPRDWAAFTLIGEAE